MKIGYRVQVRIKTMEHFVLYRKINLHIHIIEMVLWIMHTNGLQPQGLTIQNTLTSLILEETAQIL